MHVPIVTIVGRPNVGKSSLLNCLARLRISIVDPTSGVTRDRISTFIKHNGCSFELIDTGGIGIEDIDGLTEQVEAQVSIAIQKSDLILFVVDVREGVVPLDIRVAEMLRRRNQPAILIANKAERLDADIEKNEFYKLGFGEPMLISAIEGLGREELLDKILAFLPPPPKSEDLKTFQAVMKLAIVGKRNAGKSTFINKLAGEERVIVSKTPGTTRDSVDVTFQIDGNTFIAIDTAGIRRKKQTKDAIEFYSMARAERSIRRGDVVLFFLDAQTEISQVDKKICDYISQQMKPCIIVVNKWDIAQSRKIKTSQFAEYIYSHLTGLYYAPMSCISSITGENIRQTIKLAQELYRQANTRVPTAQVNQTVQEAKAIRLPPVKRNKVPKIYYATQVAVAPPTIVIFVNEPSLFTKEYKRYLANKLRQKLPFQEIPLKIEFRRSE